MAQQPDAAAAAQLARISHGSYGFKGLKDHYEDRVDAKHLGGLGLWFGVYDGHGGEHAADYVQANLGSAVERTIGETIPGFEERLEDARETAKRRKLAEGTSTTGPVLPSVREKEELRAIENAAKEADARIEELRAVGYGSPELAELRDALTNRGGGWIKRPKNEKAAATRGGVVNGGKCREAAGRSTTRGRRGRGGRRDRKRRRRAVAAGHRAGLPGAG